MVLQAPLLLHEIQDQELLAKEVRVNGYYDQFAVIGVCFACHHPDKVQAVVVSSSAQPTVVLEGALKVKKGRWKFLKRWHTKYFTLSYRTTDTAAADHANMTNYKNGMGASAGVDSTILNGLDGASSRAVIELKSVTSVRSVVNRNRKHRKSLPKAFEIFAADESSYVLKATDQSDAEEWFHCLQIAVAQAKRGNDTTPPEPEEQVSAL